MNNTTNNSKTNNTEIGNNINRSTQSANNSQDTNLKSHSIYRRFLPGLLMLLLGVVILSAPVAANAQITNYTLPPAVYVASPYGNDLLIADSPTIYAYPGTYVAYIPRLYKKDHWGSWNPKSAATVQWGQVDNSSVWIKNTGTLDNSFNITLFLDGRYKLAYELYYYNWDSETWVIQVNEWAPGIHAYSRSPYGLHYDGFFTELNYPDIFTPYYYY
jgi:hypothetical protein